MSAQTKDFVAHRAQIGRRQFVADIIVWEDEERETLAHRTFPNLGLAKAWAVKETRLGRRRQRRRT